MANQITVDGIEIDSISDTVGKLETSFTEIYGPDVDFSPNSPDGNIINDFAQIVQDELELNVQVFDSFDPDQAIGVALDMRVALNGIKRKAGTNSTTDITIVTSAPVTLQGLDGNPSPIGGEFIVADSQGNQWVLINTFVIGSAGTTILAFQAVLSGAVLTTANTLTVPVTVVVGVTSVNNPTGQLSVGTTEESDSALRIRRRQSVGITSTSFNDSMEAALLNVEGVTYARVFENDTGSTDGDGVPGHSIWVIVGGTGSASDIAHAIYAKRSAGAGMFGAQSFTIIRPNGLSFVVNWDDVEAEELFIEFTPDAITGDIETTGDTHSGTAIIDAIPSTAGMAAGYLVRDLTNPAAIPAGTTILTVDSLHQITLSANSTANHTTDDIEVVPVIVADLKTAIAAAFTAGVDETLNINGIATLVQSINSNLVLTNIGLSDDDISFVPVLSPSAKNKQFTLIAADIHIT